jgi:hypothetical protein
MRLHRDPVKHSAENTTPPAFSWRWLEGWELIFPSVGIAALALWLSMPQPTLPAYLPLPTLTPATLEETRSALLMQAEKARQVPLSFEIRAIGERFRQMGRGVASGHALSVDATERFREQVRNVLAARGPNELLTLRAVQTELFVAALANYEKHGQKSDDLLCLGGNFIEIAKAQRRLKPSATKAHAAHLLLDPDERRALFLLRWNELSGLEAHDRFRLAPTWVLLAARTRLRAPLRTLGPSELGVIENVTAVDPDYPSQVAKGLLYTKLGAYDVAAENFRGYLLDHPDAPYSVRARNHLLYVSQFLGSFRP